MSKRIQIQVCILLFIAVLAVGVAMAVKPAFGCYDSCTGCNLYCDATEIDECCGSRWSIKYQMESEFLP